MLLDAKRLLRRSQKSILDRHKDSELHTKTKSKSYEVKMTVKFLPKGGGIYEVSFGIHSKMGGYTTLMSDMSKLFAILLDAHGKDY